MADPVEVQRYELALDHLPSIGPAPVIDPAVNGALCKHAEIAPLLAELADLRDFRDYAARIGSVAAVYLRARLAELEERTRRRDAATEPPPEGEWVLGLTFGYSRVYPAEQVVVRFVKGCWLNADGAERTVLKWWPLPQTEE